MLNAIRHPKYILAGLWARIGSSVPDDLYLKVRYRLIMGEKLNLKNPQTFSEKLQWLKLYDRKQEYTKMVDKYAVKEYVASIIGSDYIIPTLGIWDNPDDIEWDRLPEKYVLKTTHGGGSKGVVICKNKATFDKQAAIRRLKKNMVESDWQIQKEWPYKNVPKRIIAEKYIESVTETRDLLDYKWFCFNGEPKYCQVIQNRTTDESIDFFDINWNHQEFIGLNQKAHPATYHVLLTKHLDTQIRIARKLSTDIPYSRIDLYEVGEMTYFGEITFYPLSGMGKFFPEKYNEILGQMIILP